MLPIIEINGEPNPQAMVLAVRAFIALERGDETGSARLVEGEGGRQVRWLQDRATFPIDWSIWRGQDVLWINLNGTTNWQQVVAYLTTVLPLYDHNIGAYAVEWAGFQARRIFSPLREEINRLSVSRLVICGQSLGAAVGHYLSRLVVNYLSPYRVPGIAEQFFGRLNEGNILNAFLDESSSQVGRATIQARENRPAMRVDLLTFGEPRCIGAGAEYPPNSHWRIVGTLLESQELPPDRLGSRVDPITLLPINVAVAPGAGILSGLPGLRTIALKAGLSVVPVHYGIPRYLTTDGRFVAEPLGALQRFAAETATGLASLLVAQSRDLHFLEDTYLPGSVSMANGRALFPQNGGSPFPFQEMRGIVDNLQSLTTAQLEVMRQVFSRVVDLSVGGVETAQARSWLQQIDNEISRRFRGPNDLGVNDRRLGRQQNGEMVFRDAPLAPQMGQPGAVDPFGPPRAATIRAAEAARARLDFDWEPYGEEELRALQAQADAMVQRRINQTLWDQADTVFDPATQDNLRVRPRLR